ncbi:MAG: tRNA pseudouridine(38-40) synthase TruA, partial [Candidatus Marinimicrobia bacterium]|nr:tRNA pseudouridine(38-40) synthase TruA [Candidatus Neomarinimicrobiota bacterium]
MSRFSIIVQYDGTAFRGWQLQKHDRTIQGELEKSLIKFNNNIMIRVYGAGRTDTGVHATGQVAHFDLKTNLEPIELKNALNGHLPKDIRIMNCNL